MNGEWSKLNKIMQTKIKKSDTYKDGFSALFELRDQLAKTITSFEPELKREDFNAIPFINANGYHSKTIAYSIWHISRIEDVVAHTLIKNDEQVFFAENYQKRINSPVVTTGNELTGQEIAEFSEQLNLSELYSYMFKVKESTEKIIKSLPYAELTEKIPDERKQLLKSLNVVSADENAV